MSNKKKWAQSAESCFRLQKTCSTQKLLIKSIRWSGICMLRIFGKRESLGISSVFFLFFFFTLSWNPTIYNMICWFAGSLGQMTWWPSVWCSKYYFLFIISCKILFKIRFNLFLNRFTKIKIKSFECHKSIRNYKEDNACNIRCLVDNSFVPTNQLIIL